MTWTITALLPLPILIVTDPASSVDLSCVYLGLGCAWITTHLYRTDGLPRSLSEWRTRMLAIALAVTANTAAFVFSGIVAGAQSNLPIPLLAALSALPAATLTPWLLRRVPHPYMAIVLAATLLFAAKLLACTAALLTYGQHYVEEGYTAADWHTAKLMISLFWTFSTLLSLTFLLAEYKTCKHSPAPPDPHTNHTLDAGATSQPSL